MKRKKLAVAVGVGLVFLPLFGVVAVKEVKERRVRDVRERVISILALPTEVVLERTEEDHISVLGDDQFRVQVARALTVLASNAPRYHSIVTNNIRSIHMGPYTGFGPDPQACIIAKTTTVDSVTWIAAILVRQGLHSGIYHRMERELGGVKVPPEAWRGWAQQKLCAEETLTAMRDVGALEHEIQYMERTFKKWYPDRQQDAANVPSEQIW